MLVILSPLLEAFVSFSMLVTVTTFEIFPAETTRATIVKTAPD